jgi:hypothetical protein
MSTYSAGDAIYDSFGRPVNARESGNSCDALYEIADGLQAIARALRALGNGNAATDMGAIEGLGVAIRESVTGLSGAISSALNEMNEALR